MSNGSVLVLFPVALTLMTATETYLSLNEAWYQEELKRLAQPWHIEQQPAAQVVVGNDEDSCSVSQAAGLSRDTRTDTQPSAMRSSDDNSEAQAVTPLSACQNHWWEFMAWIESGARVPDSVVNERE
jgi:hypothetical protein